jgi:hypothetical protein
MERAAQATMHSSRELFYISNLENMSILGILLRPKFALNLKKCIVDSGLVMTHRHLSRGQAVPAEFAHEARFQLKDAGWFGASSIAEAVQLG